MNFFGLQYFYYPSTFIRELRVNETYGGPLAGFTCASILYTYFIVLSLCYEGKGKDARMYKNEHDERSTFTLCIYYGWYE